jgi:curved DNA-binding protein CbpA
MSVKDYYQILGVSPDAEEVVIRAAYKAMVQRYHPDRYSGSEQEAQEKMRELNEAYETLSNAVKRSDYDATLKAQQKDSKSNPTGESKIEDAWRIILKYHPNVGEHFKSLQKFSDELANEFKDLIIESKEVSQAEKIAKEAEKRFLEERFGADPKVLKFARDLFLDGQKAAAKELNETLIALGDAMPFNEVYIDIQKKYRPEIYAEQQRAAETIIKTEAIRKVEAIRKAEERRLEQIKKEKKTLNNILLIGLLITCLWWLVSL